MNTPAALPDFLSELRKRASGDVRTDDYSKVFYSTDASIYQVEPYGVLIPRTVEDVQAAVELAARFHIPIVPRTGGSSLAGQAVNEALIIDMSRHLDQVLAFNKEERWIRVQPGMVLDELNSYLRPHGLHFGPDPASSNRAAIGGIVSNNSTGSHSIMYGMTADHVLEMNTILSDGAFASFGPRESSELSKYVNQRGQEGVVYRRLLALTRDATHRKTIGEATPRHWRRCGGYNLDRLIGPGPTFQVPQDHRFNLAKLVCGAEGTLAVITDVKLNLVPIPKRTALAIVHFSSLYEALKAVPIILEVNPSAVELLDNLGLTLCREVPQYARLLRSFIDGEPNCVLITEFYGANDQELKEKVENLKRHLSRERAGARTVMPVYDDRHQQDVWTVRKVGLGLLMSIKGDHKPIPFIEDAAVPVAHLADYVTEVEKFCHSIGTEVAYYAHASAGCVHIRPLINTKKAEEVAKLPEITAFSVELLKGYGGSLSSEHGDGRVRSWMNEQFFGPDLYSLYQELKTAFDPNNILNPGNIVDAPLQDSNLRYGEAYEAVQLQTHLDFSVEMGFDRAVEMCNGAGICRKKTTGTMCPSFMATREEEHSTRGRANALRAALSGSLPTKDLTSARMREVMDLCLGCKACKAECPSSVDMAKIKVEFLSQFHEEHGPSFRDQLFGEIHTISRLSSGPMAPLINRVLGDRRMKTAMETLIGISRSRALPSFSRRPFKRRLPRKTNSGKSARKVVLLADTFNSFNSPEVALAAYNVLDRAGLDVIVPSTGCCGRPSFSKGLVERARVFAKIMVDCLHPYAQEEVPIIGLEPSCLLMFRDEYLYLLPGNEAALQVAEHTVLFEEFIDKLQKEGSLNLSFKSEEKEVLVHGHCHQKAMVGMESSKNVLELPAGYSVQEIDSGCCGMAGSFGYEKEHYGLSIKMAERRLLPAVRHADANTLIVATGVSCRQQIHHGTGKVALHPAQVLHDALIN